MSPGVDGMGDLEEGRHRSRAAADRASLVAVSALPGRGDPGVAFFTADLLNGTQAHVLAVIEHASRHITILGVTPHPTGPWTAQQARNLLMDLGEQPHRVTFMIRDRGPDFTAAFDAVLADPGIPIVRCNIATPRMNAIAERWIGGCRRELLDRTLAWNQAHLRRILRAYEIHPNQRRPHHSLHRAAETATRTGRP
jgi:putative transposase